MQIYFKLCEFGRTDNITILHELWALKSSSNLFKQYTATYLPNTWYDLNAELKKASYTKELNCNDLNTISSLYLGKVGSGNYTLYRLKAIAFSKKEDADAFQGGEDPQNELSDAIICDTYTNEQNGYGYWSTLAPAQLTKSMQDNGTYYILFTINNYLNPMKFPPMIKCGNLNLGWDTKGGAKDYSSSSGTMVMTTNCTLQDIYTNSDYPNGKIETYLNNKLVATINHPNKGDKIYTPNATFTNNDVIEPKYVADGQPTQPTQPTHLYWDLPQNEDVTIDPTKAKFGEKTTITVTPKQGYKIDSYTLSLNNPNDSNKSFTWIYTNGAVVVDLTNYTSDDYDFLTKNTVLSCHVSEIPKQIPITLDLTHCESDTSSITENTNKTVTLTADDGYIFDNDVIVYTYSIDLGIYVKNIIKANKAKVISFDLNVGAFADYKKDIDDETSYPHIIAIASKVDEKPTGTQALNIYDMTDGELNTFMNSLITQITTSADGSTNIESANFQQFVNQVYRLPFDLPQSMLKDVNNVKSGKWHIDVNTKQITGDTLIINAGTIKINPIYNNANDYNPITCKLYLPFVKEVSLDISDLINHTISIKYNIDLLTGETTVIVNNEDGNIFTNQFNITTDLEFYGLFYTKTVGHLNSTFINDILTAFIKLTYRKPVENIVSYETNEHGKLKDYTGFTRCKNLVLNNTKENYSESNEINQLLLNGVVINDTKGN